MKGLYMSSPRRARLLILHLLALITLATGGYTGLPRDPFQAGPPPTLTIEAPGSVEVGETIEIQLIVEHAKDLAGYETQILFDTSAAHFSGLHQRENDLKKFGRDVIPLEATELPEGSAIGLASCPFPDCVELTGNPQPKGANGKVWLATVLIGTDQQGALEILFENIKFVDPLGNLITVETPTTQITVQVGVENGATFPAPASSWQLSASPASPGNSDVTGDGIVNYADAIEVAIEWTLSRGQNQPCGSANDPSRDVNGDGCIDVADIQTVLGSAGSTQTAPEGSSDESESGEFEAAAALTFTVNSTSDAGDSNPGDGVCASSSGCTLRAAIQEANQNFGPDTIRFNIPGTGVQTIQLGSRLPSLWDGSGGTTIDGYSQPGSQANTDSLVSNAKIMIQIRGNGASAFHALVVQSSGNRIQGLSIFNVKRSIWFYGAGASDNIVTGNFIGTNSAGTFVAAAHVLSASGVHIDVGPDRNRVGGSAPAERNVISGNARHGLEINSEGTDGNVIVNNLIGLAPAGDRRLQNFRHGIDINAGPSNTVIGGTATGQRNIISGNGEQQNVAFTAGIEISHDTLTTNTQVIGNCFGTEPTCNSGPSWAYNGHYSIRIEDGVNNNVIAANVIGNSPFGGIRIDGSGTNSNQVYDNRIGVSLNNTAIPVGGFGIQIASSSKFNRIGPNNIIANNPVGVELLNANDDNNTITRNSIFNNNRLGIDLATTPGVTANDSGDTDTGANEELNWPVLNSATTSQVTGTACAQSIVPKPCTIEIFIAERKTNDSGSGNYGQGKTFVGSTTTNPDGSFTATISGVTAGQYLTATATDAAGNTSEFSLNKQVSEGSGTTTYASDQFTRNVTDGWGNADIGGSYTLQGSAANFDVNGTAGTITLPSAGVGRTAVLRSVSALDVNITFRFQTDKLASGSHYTAYFIARSVSSNTEYVGQIRLTTNRTVHLRAVRFVNGTSTFLGSEVTVTGLTHAASSYIRVRGQVVGTNPTTIRLKAWADGQTEPASWQYSVTDSTSSLQAAGAVGLRAFIPSAVTNAPVVFTFEDFLVTPP